MNKDDRKADFSVNDSQSLRSYPSPNRPNVEFRFSEIVRRHNIASDISRNRPVVNRQKFWEDDVMSSLKSSLQLALNRELSLSHALSRTQLDLTEKEIKFEEAVEDGVCLKKQMQELSSRLVEQQDMNSSLQGQIKTLKSNIGILSETIDKQRMEILAMANALKTKESVEANKLEELPTNGLDVKKVERSTQELFRQLRLDIEWERSERIKMENAKTLSMSQLNKIENELSTSREKVIRLEGDLQEMEQTYRLLITSLSAEKANIEADCERWKNDYRKMEEHILQTPQSRESDSLITIVRLNNTVRGPENLFLEPIATKEKCMGVSSSAEERQQSDQSSPNTKTKPLHSPIPETSEEIQKYLHITASVVKLHFPKIEEVSSKWLIDMVKQAPFYLYHDLMMNYMRQLNKEIAEEETNESEGAEGAEEETKDSKEADAGWMARFLQIAHNFPLSPRTKANIKRASKQIKI